VQDRGNKKRKHFEATQPISIMHLKKRKRENAEEGEVAHNSGRQDCSWGRNRKVGFWCDGGGGTNKCPSAGQLSGKDGGSIRGGKQKTFHAGNLNGGMGGGGQNKHTQTRGKM